MADPEGGGGIRKELGRTVNWLMGSLEATLYLGTPAPLQF